MESTAKKARFEIVGWQDEVLAITLRVDATGARGPPLVSVAARVADSLASADGSPLTDATSSFLDDVLMGALAAVRGGA